MTTTPTLLIRSATSSRSTNDRLPGFTSIGGSVGAGGRNGAKDVLAVQVALNAVSPAAAGPAPALAEDGIVGPKTIAAIRAIQTAWTTVVDGRVDPNGPTLRMLNQLAGAASAKAPKGKAIVSFSVGAGAAGAAAPPSGPSALPADWVRAQTRLEFVQTAVMPAVAVAVAVFTALQKLALAQQHIGSLQPGNPPTGDALRSEGRLAFLFAAKHFRLHESQPTNSLLALQQVTASYLRVMEAFRTRTISTDAGPRFARLFSLPFIPPQVKDSPGVAYCGSLSGSQNPNQITPSGDLSDGIYLLPGFDPLLHMGIPILLHELAHLSGGVSPSSAITDMTFASAAIFDAQPTRQRLINVSVYEYFGSEISLGTLFEASAYPGNSWSAKLPLCTGGGRLIAPLTPTIGPDPLAFPAGFAGGFN